VDPRILVETSEFFQGLALFNGGYLPAQHLQEFDGSSFLRMVQLISGDEKRSPARFIRLDSPKESVWNKNMKWRIEELLRVFD
jgi:hypothetical protein